MQICLWWLFSQVPASWVRFGIPRKLSQIWQVEIMLGRDRYLPFFGWAEKSLQMLEDLLHSEPFKSTGSLGGNRPCGLVWNLDTWPLLVWTAAVSPAGWCRFHCSVTQVRVWVCRVVFGPFHLWPVGYVQSTMATWICREKNSGAGYASNECTCLPAPSRIHRGCFHIIGISFQLGIPKLREF